MVDLIAFGLVLIVVAAILVRKTSAGVAIMALLAGVMLEELLAPWAINQLPKDSAMMQEYIPVVVRLLITFTPMVASVVAVKIPKQNRVLSLLASLVLGFMIVFFGLQILEDLSLIKHSAENSGLLHFVGPYTTAIIAASAALAVLEMIMSHRVGASSSGKKKKHNSAH